MSLEQEIKLHVTQEQRLDLRQVAGLSECLDREVFSQHLLSTYFDTPDKAIMKFGAGLRLRKIGEQWLQTVKSNGQAIDGLHQRDEWEHALAGPEFDKSLLQQTVIGPLVDSVTIWTHIEPLFTTEFEREVWWLKLANDTLVELAYDIGEVRAGDKRIGIHEIELELKQGDIAVCLALAESLKSALPLQPSDISKAGLGYGLLNSKTVE